MADEMQNENGGDALERETVDAFAASRGGVCLDAGGLRESDPMRWRCGMGHEFEGSFRLLHGGGYWCPRCFPSVDDTSGWDYDKIAGSDPLLARFHAPR